MFLQRILSISALLAFIISSTAFAATGDVLDLDSEPLPELEPLTPVISGPDDIAVGRTLVLDASSSVGLGEETTYRWYRDDRPQPISRTVEAVYTPETAGLTTVRLVIRTGIEGEVVEAEIEKQITVYERKIVILASEDIPPEKIAVHQQTAEAQGVYLLVIQPEGTGPIVTEDALVKLVKDQPQVLAGAEAIVLWTDGIAGLQALMRALEEDTDRLQAIKNQSLVMVSDRSLQTLERGARGPFSVLRPKQIVVTRTEAINPLLSIASIDDLRAELSTRDIDYEIVDARTAGIRPWNLLSSLVNFMLTHGVSSQTVILLLMLPVIATILAFLKQIVGVTTFGLYTPSIVALSMLALGWYVGLAFLLFILVTGYATRSFMRRWRMLYVPKVAIIITVVSITLLLLLGVGAQFGVTLPRDTIFVLLIMSTLSESFLNVKTEEGLYSAVLGIGETILAALLCVFIVQWPWLQSLVLAYPEIILLTIVINAVIGQWTGLRLVEYFRFREVFAHLQEEE